MSQVGVALTDDFVVVGSKGDLEMTLYITVNGISHVAHLCPTPGEFFVQYTLFGVPIESDKFRSLKSPRFPPIRDSFRIQSTREDIASFLCENPVELHLCQKKQSTVVLASATVEFDSLFSNGVDFSEATSTCAFTFHSSVSSPIPSASVSLELLIQGKVNKTKQQQDSTHDIQVQTDLTPVNMREKEDIEEESRFRIEVVSIDLDPLDDEDGAEEVLGQWQEGFCIGISLDNAVARSPCSFHCDEYGQMERHQVQGVFLNIRSQDLKNVRLELRSESGALLGHGSLPSTSDGPLDTTVTLVDIHDSHRGEARVKVTRCEVSDDTKEEHKAMKSMIVNTSTFISTDLSARVESDDMDKVCLFRMTIDLRSAKGLENASYNVYLQYSNKLLGGSQIFQTRPPILIDRFSDRIIPHGLRLFQFHASRADLDALSQSEPIVLEMWHKDKYTPDKRVGFCALPLRELLERRPYFQWAGQTFATMGSLEAQREKTFSHQNKSATGAEKQSPIVQLQVLEKDLVICSFEDSGAVRRVATVKSTLTLENLGPKSSSSHHISRVSTPAKQSSPDRTQRAASPPPPPPQDEDHGEDTIEVDSDNKEKSEDRSEGNKNGDMDDLHLAWQAFEKWKEEQRLEWEYDLRTKEAVRMSELEQAWARKEHERALAMKTAQEEMNKLEERMLRAVTEAEKRERTVARLEVELQRAADQRMADLEILSRRVRDECDHQVSLHKNKCAALENDVARLRKALAHSEKRCAKVEEEFAAYREKVRQSPEAELQREIAKLQGLNAQLHSQIESERESLMSERLAKEGLRARVAQLQKELDRQKSVESRRAERQLDNLRLEYLAREERYVLDGDRQQLLQLRQELNQLKSVTLRQPLVYPSLGSQEEDGEEEEAERRNENPAQEIPRRERMLGENEHVARLQKEKEELLSTGLYGPQHPIIQQLDRHMQLARDNLL